MRRPPWRSAAAAGIALDQRLRGARGKSEGCAEHEEFRATCDECEPAQPDEVSKAEWHWYVDVHLVTVDDEENRSEYVDHAHVLTSSTDPRCVEYSEMPLR